MAASSITTTVTELPESRVRVQAEVPAAEVSKSVDRAAKTLGRSVRVPGFRSGKVPPQVIISRIGRETVLEEAVRDSLGNWYSAAIGSAQISPVGDPELDISDLPKDGESLHFSIEIGVLPLAKLGKYKGLEVGKADPDVDPGAVDNQLERLRERMGKLETAETPVEKGNFVLIDYSATIDGQEGEDGEVRDQLIEVGADRIAPGLDDQLVGMQAGESKTITLTVPRTHSGDAENEETPESPKADQSELIAQVTIKEVKKSVLPPLDDSFANDVGFESLEQLRDDITERMAEAGRAEVERNFRQAVLEAAVENAKVEVPKALIEARARELWEQVIHSLRHQKISKEMYIGFTGKSEQENIDGLHDDAEAGLKQEAVVKAVIEAEKIEPTDDELVERLQEMDPRVKKPQKLLQQLKSENRYETLKANIAERQAVELLVDSAKPIPEKQAKAREKIWTPDKKKAGDEANVEGLWTPSSK